MCDRDSGGKQWVTSFFFIYQKLVIKTVVLTSLYKNTLGGRWDRNGKFPGGGGDDVLSSFFGVGAKQ